MTSSIEEGLNQIRDSISNDCTLVAVSKTKPNEAIKLAYNLGQLDFGENKVQELTTKADLLPKDIRWHMIGHLQRNKVKYIVPFVHLIHGVDSERLLREINKQGAKIGRKINILLQVHIAKEESKFGFDEEEIRNLIKEGVLKELQNVTITGLMGMATHTEDELLVRKEFASLKAFFDELNQVLTLRYLSMGMTNDYKIALEEGSNMVRIGSAIFGARNKP